MSFITMAAEIERKKCCEIINRQKASEWITESECRVASYGSEYRQYIRAFYPIDRKIKGYVIDIHGGGLIAGEIAQNAGFADWLVHEGYVVFLIEYRLIPEVKFKDQLEDILTAFNFIQTAVSHYPDRPFYLVADSAGCHLALFANAMNGEGDMLAADFGINITHNLTFKGVWFNAPMFETTGFNKIGIFLAKHYYGRNWQTKSFAPFLKNPECLFKFLPDNIVIITSHGDKQLKSQAFKAWQQMDYILRHGPSLGFGREFHEHDWNVLDPTRDKITIGINKWALAVMTGASDIKTFEDIYD